MRRICAAVDVKRKSSVKKDICKGRDMCGIIGIVKNSGDAAGEVFEGLKRLEYRGYDSAGIAALDGGKISVCKRRGGVENLKEGLGGLKGGVCMGHTRWATHGEPSDVNAHPHVAGKVAVVHNGIIENFARISAFLQGEGRKFLSQTDSEAIAHLIDFYYGREGDILKATARAAKQMEGSFALCIMCADFDGLIAVRYKSSQVIGFSEDKTFVASDIPALPSEVREIYLPEDGVISVIERDKTRVYDCDLRPLECERRGVCIDMRAADKGGYAHFMLKEIEDSPRTICDTAEGIARCCSLQRCLPYIKAADKIILTGCGTAYNAGMIAKRFFVGRKVFCCAEIASELRYFPPEVTKNTVVIAISQSGETADTVEAVSLLKERGAAIIAVTNCGYSTLTRVAHVVVPVCAHAEICVAATKSYTGQIAALYLLSRADGERQRAARELEEVSALVSKVIGEDEKAKEIASLCSESRAVFFLGRGSDCDAAVEASLKLKEVSYIFSDAYPAGELKHGTLALIDGDTLSVFIICEESVAEKCLNGLEQVLSRKGKAAVITCFEDVAASLPEGVAVWLIPRTAAALQPMVCAPALQKIAYYTAVKLGKDPDKPRNLAKSVTVE